MNYKNDNDYKGGQGYKDLPFFRQAETIYDFTVEFLKTYLDQKSRTNDQMEQAGRSGKQNIAEGYLQKSIEGKLHLLKVARGSLEELLNDYLDCLRQRNLPLWDKDDPNSAKIRSLVYKYKNYNDYKSYNGYKDYKIYLENPERAANAMICLINQTNQLLDQKIRWLQKEYQEKGGTAENLRRERTDYLKNQDLIKKQKQDKWLEKVQQRLKEGKSVAEALAAAKDYETS